MTSISHPWRPPSVGAAPKAKARNPPLDRARTFLTLVVLLHHAVIPYTYFGHTDPKSWIGFDMVVLATDSFFMAMFFFLSGLFVWPGLAPQGAADLSARPPAAARPAVRDRALTVIPIAYYAIALRQHPEISFAAFWWKTVTVGPVAERPALVRLGVAGVRSDGEPALSAVSASASIRSTGCRSTASTGRPSSSCFCLRSALPSIFRRCSISDRAAGLSSGRSRCRPAACCSMPPISSSAPASAPRISIAAFSAQTDGWRRSSWGWMLADPRSVLPAVGDDLHQARNTG